MDEIVKDFLIESNENLDRLDQELVQLESEPDSKALLGSIFRTIHTIKGSCGFLGFARLEKVAHAGESLLSLLRDGKLRLRAEITSGLLAMVDAVRHMLGEIQTTERDGENEYPELREELKRLQNTGAGPSPEAKPEAAMQILAASPQAASPIESRTVIGKETEAAPEDAPAPLRVQVATPAQATPAVPPSGAAQHRPGEDKIAALLIDRGVITQDQLNLALREQERGGDRKALGEVLSGLGFCKAEEVAAMQQVLETRAREASGETIRVGVNLIDKLMNLVGELVLARNQLLQYANGVHDVGFQAISQRMNLIATELQEEVMKTRMQPIGNIWSKFPRTVRDVALGCGKEVQIEMEGKETELDKTIIEAIKDPLTHLVRNSVDHGIELPEARVNVGKPVAGRLTLRAFHEGGQVNIEISDDGAGLNRERIRNKAIERGLATAEQAARMADREIFNMIFLPGFSTAEKITNVSGRGVGMDVVKTNVEKIGGTVDVQSLPGKGTTVRVKIPLTLAIIPVLVVTCRGERFAIPQVSLLELVRLDPEKIAQEIEMVHGVPVYRLRGRLLPLVYLARELQLPDDGIDEAERAGNIVVLQAEDRQFGLMVDGINDTEEIVVKPLRRQLKAVKTFAGSTIMGDGRVALILDVMGLAQRASVVTEIREHGVGDKSAGAQDVAAQKHRFLLFAGPGGSRMAMPLDTLARLEELPANDVERAGTQWVAQYRGRILPLINLEFALEERRKNRQQAKLLAGESQAPLQVLVCNHAGRTVGLVVEEILDIVEHAAELKYPASRPGVLYSTVIDERVTELIDVPAVLQSAGFGAGKPAASLAKAAEAPN
jgi:two-component system, chemotaxis family, sensor kinase CheA